MRSIFYLSLSFCFASTLSINAQDTTHFNATDTLKKNISKPPQTDLGIEWHRWFHHSLPKVKDTGRQQHSILPVVGYSLQTGFAAVVAATYTFYPSKENKETQNPSNLLTSVTYSQYNQVIFPIQADLWSKHNTYNMVIDWRFLAYPSTTFGLGGKTKLSDGYTINFNYIKLHQSILRKIHNKIYAGLGIYYDRFWNVKEILDSPNTVTSFDKYGFSKQSTSVGLAFRILLDDRDNPINASRGTYFNLVARPNFTLLGSNNNWNSMLIEIRKYYHFPGSSKNVLALWSYNWFTIGSGKPPYLLLPSTGWDDFYNTGRGYIQGRYRGRNMIYLESEYRIGLTQNGLLGMVVFANAQSFSRNINKELNLIIPAFGTGLRIKLNKITGANLCIDYGFGVDGSSGIAVNLGEVF